jgi:hypothetical protein
MKKIIIELHEDSQNYGILVLTDDNGKYIGVLELYSFTVKEGSRKLTVGDLDSKGWREFAAEILKKALKVCEEKGYKLWKY